MKVAGGRTTSIWEWIVVFGVTAITVAVAEGAGVPPKWGNASVLTVILFVAVILSLRPAWGRAVFWLTLVALFSIHTLVVCLATSALPANSRGLRGIPFIGAGLAESALMVGILWNAARLAGSPFRGDSQNRASDLGKR